MGIRTGSRGSALPVVLFLPLSPVPFHVAHGVLLLDPAELLSSPFLAGSLFFSFLPLDSLQSGLGSLLFFFAGCQIESHVTQCKLGGRDYGPLRWPGGGLQVGTSRALVIQLHRACWRRTRIDTSVSLCLPML